MPLSFITLCLMIITPCHTIDYMLIIDAAVFRCAAFAAADRCHYDDISHYFAAGHATRHATTATPPLL